MTGSHPRLPHVIDPDVILVGTYACEHGNNWIAHVPGRDEVDLDGCFTATELRRLAEVLEGRHG